MRKVQLGDEVVLLL